MNGNDVDLVEAVDNAIKSSVTQPQVTGSFKWQNPEAYRADTGKRFRMTKEEQAAHGNTEQGRQAAFEARLVAGLL